MDVLAIAGDVQIGEDGAAPAVDPSRTNSRAGAQALSVLSTPLNLRVLRSLADRPMRLAQLRQATGLPAQTTLRGHLANLSEIGVLTKRPAKQMPYAVENELTPMGRDLLGVADMLEGWLSAAPDGPISIENSAAGGAVKALIDGWASTIMQGIAARPLSLTELDSLISEHSYPALERRLASMRMAGLAEPQPSPGMGTPYTVTDWGRRGIAPLAAASHCERVHMRNKSAPATPIDIEAAFLLAAPLVGLPKEAAGSCQLEVEVGRGAARSSAGVQITVEDGKVVSCVSGVEPNPGTYVVGSAVRWFRAVREGSADHLRFGGDQLGKSFVGGLHAALRPGLMTAEAQMSRFPSPGSKPREAPRVR